MVKTPGKWGVALLATLAVAANLAGAAETRDPYTYFFNPHTGDFKAELADAKSASKKAVFLLLGEFVASGAYKSRKFAQYRQERSRRNGS